MISSFVKNIFKYCILIILNKLYYGAMQKMIELLHPLLHYSSGCSKNNKTYWIFFEIEFSFIIHKKLLKFKILSGYKLIFIAPLLWLQFYYFFQLDLYPLYGCWFWQVRRTIGKFGRNTIATYSRLSYNSSNISTGGLVDANYIGILEI